MRRSPAVKTQIFAAMHAFVFKISSLVPNFLEFVAFGFKIFVIIFFEIIPLTLKLLNSNITFLLITKCFEIDGVSKIFRSYHLTNHCKYFSFSLLLNALKNLGSGLKNPVISSDLLISFIECYFDNIAFLVKPLD